MLEEKIVSCEAARAGQGIKCLVALQLDHLIVLNAVFELHNARPPYVVVAIVMPAITCSGETPAV